MTKKYSTKKALMTSALSLLLCFSMLVGTTFAWFTDSVTSANNIIKSGNLDVEMYWADGTKAVPSDETGWTDASTGAIFNNDKWEPGYVEVRHIKIANEGNLALKYKVNIVANGTVSDLSDVIDVYYVDPAQQVADRTALTDDNKIGTLTEVLANLANTASGELLANENDTITLALKMQETAGNQYQNKSIGTSFSVQLLATQLTYEKDSFDDQYDKDADYTASVGTADELKAALAAGGNIVLTADVTVDESTEIPAGVAAVIDLNGKTLTGATSSVNVFVNEGELTITGSGEIKTRNILNRPSGKLVIDGDITIIGGAPTAGSAIWNEGDAVIINATIQQINTTNYAIKNATTDATMIINNATVTGIHGAVANDVGTMIINGGYYEVTGSSTDHVIYAPNGGVIINDGTFKLSQANASSIGSTIIDGSVTVNGGTFDSVDGALAYNGQAGLVINGGTFLNKATTVYGGAFAQFVATTSTATTNADGSITVTPYKVSSADELADAITNGTTAVSLSNDITLNTQLEVNGVLTIIGNGNTITAPTSGTRVVNVMDNTGDVTVTLIGVKLNAADKERGISFYNNSGDLDVTIIGCEVTAKYYGVNVAGQNAKATLNIKDSTLKGYCAFQTYSPNTVATFDNCVLEGVNLGYNNTQYPYSNNFATVVVNSLATNSTLTFNNCTIIATEKESATAPAGEWPATQAHIIDNATGITIHWNNCTFIKNGVEVSAPESIN